ncbi:MAG: hypothetical protein HRU82_01655 [Nitrospira sp.]|nr:MAG: hypothetical protein HRU82_01655 [Nitrospira sp.]
MNDSIVQLVAHISPVRRKCPLYRGGKRVGDEPGALSFGSIDDEPSDL